MTRAALRCHLMLTPRQAINDLVKEAPARDFVADIYQHCKHIGHGPSAPPLLDTAGNSGSIDESYFDAQGQQGDCGAHREMGKLRVWRREPSVGPRKASPPVCKKRRRNRLVLPAFCSRRRR